MTPNRREPPRREEGGDHAGVGGAALAGALLAAVANAAAGFLLDGLRPLRFLAGWADAFRGFLVAGGWLWMPLWGAALGLLLALPRVAERRARIVTLILGLALGALPLVARPRVGEPPAAAHPRTMRDKSRAILKWSFGSPATVEKILPLSHDPDSRVREQAVLALGVNLIVSDIERQSVTRPPRYRGHPLRARLEARLLEVLRDDPDPAVRAEAARALWKAPGAFGRQPAAAETLARTLDRARESGSLERLTWLALDAAAGPPDSGLIAAARRFAATAPGGDLARAARIAARERAP